MNTRRQFLITAQMAMVGAAVACRREPQTAGPASKPSTPGAPPTFASAPEVGPPVTASTFAEAEKLVQVTMNGTERDMAARSWRKSMAPLLERRVGPRKIALDPDVAPAT